MIPAIVVFIYLAAVVYIGVFAFRKSKGAHGAEDYFLANRSLGTFVFLMSLFGTNMTAFAILGSSGHAFNNGIVTFGLMASSSGLVIPLTIFLCGTRVWALGKKYGFMTPVQMFRDRWECGHIGTVIFAVQAILLVPYIIIGIMGGGTTLNAISGGRVPFWFGGAIVAMVVMSYVFFGGMRGTAWVNTFQTILFLVFGAIAVTVIGAGMGGFSSAVEAMANSPAFAPLLTRERISPYYFFSYTFIPLSAIAFPHIAIFCLTAKKMSQFKKTVILYPLCIMAIWLPCVFLGVMANRVADVPQIRAKQEARRVLATQGKTMEPEAREELREKSAGDDVILLLLERYAPLWLAGLLGAGIMAAVMASDSQILALSTMFTEDVFAFYGGKARFGESVQVQTGRIFVIILTILAYAVALRAPESIFELAIQYAFSGFAALSPLLIAALFWRGSTKWGALAATVWTISAVLAVAVFQELVPAPAPGQTTVVATLGGMEALARTYGGTTVFGFMPVVPMVIVSTLLMFFVSLLTSKPSRATVEKYFPARA
ncbi:MAG TPA: sodium:solute symporter family protein [Pyrinomonadaceae bacterium]|jgi:SSS family solute:Na+ symporter|nr:sodium:solute symporter family protein [Pyrinomonadaceae bacterium]